MNDDRKTIGSGGKPGRGNHETSPSAAARSLAGGGTHKKPAARPKKSASAPGPSTPKGATPHPSGASSPPPRADKPRLRAVTDEDAAAAAAAAAEEAAGRARTAGAAPLSAGLPIDEILVAVAEAAQRVIGSDWESRIATLLATIRKRLSGDYEVDDFGFDPQIAEVLTLAIEPLAEKWFRLEVRGVENIPADGGALLVGNHSGTVPLDGLITGYAVKKYAGRNLRPLGADLVFSLPIIGQVARKVGATLACQEDAERLLTTGELAGVWPEGFKGVGKPFAERYKLQRFGRGGFVSSAMRAQVPIVPVSIVGAEEIYPLVGNVPSLARLLGLPYLPITPFFPLLGPLGLVPLPSKWIIEFGEPVRTDAYEPEAADDPMLLFNVTDQVRETIQQTLYQLLVDRGNAFF
ncbi:lysophospholipid acyltransferase family protein [Aeromicrobium wangtongii]|uniref:lysophospholipid acyltransferase family protein n=1 Tax=Aeromicrobium wangtongii TaxID=2969247 RepID=UPI002017FB5B|nr:lysophospholipid acyltransferase family protein [Aeromicrobium wangtongii]MCL3820262.1 acyltransferase family protein [Aeromicrobium wangtongii]